MKAKIKATGEIVEVVPHWGVNKSTPQYQEYGAVRFFQADELEFIYNEPTSQLKADVANKINGQINNNMDEAKWEQRLWESAKEIMAVFVSASTLTLRLYCINPEPEEDIAKSAISYAKALIKEYKEQLNQE